MAVWSLGDQRGSRVKVTSEGTLNVPRRHIWGGLLWLAAAVMVVYGFGVADNSVVGNLGLGVFAAAAAYTACSSQRAIAISQREAFELGLQGRGSEGPRRVK